MSPSTVVTFFYGSYINRAVLREVDLEPARIEVAWLPGFDIDMRPIANLVPSNQRCVYGVLATATHDELARLYDHAETVLGGVYLPRAVLAFTPAGQAEPALCYIAPRLSGARASADYVARIVEPARAYGFPEWYIERLESFVR